MLRINEIAPNFDASTTIGNLNFHKWSSGSWVILFSHPKDFTPVCTTELGYVSKLKTEFDKRKTKVIGLSTDSVEDHLNWISDIEETQSCKMNFPLIGDNELKVSKLYDMIHPNATPGVRTAQDNATIRSVFILGPDKQVKAMLIYPMSAGRNFDEILRLLDALQMNANHQVATPVNWKKGDEVVIPPAISNEQANKKYPDGYKTLKPYLRLVKIED